MIINITIPQHFSAGYVSLNFKLFSCVLLIVVIGLVFFSFIIIIVCIFIFKVRPNLLAPLCRTNFCVLSKIFHSYLYTYKYTTTCIVFVNSKYFVCKLQATLHYIHMLSRFVPHPSSTSLFNFITFLIFLCDFFHLLDLNSNHNGSLYLPLPVNRFNYIQFFLESF